MGEAFLYGWSCLFFIMAILHAKESSYSNKKRKHFFVSIVFSAVAVLIWLWWGNNILHRHIMPMEINIVMILCFCLTGGVGQYFWRQYRKASSGDTGIERSLDVLKDGLPDDYQVFTNVTLEGTFCNTVVVGTNGVFIINTKNHNGEITPTDDREWMQEKVGRRGTHYSAPMRNPIKQLKRQIYIASQYFRAHNINVWIDGIVYFTNPDLILHGTADQYTNKGRGVLSFILDYPVRKPLSEDKIREISALLLSFV